MHRPCSFIAARSWHLKKKMTMQKKINVLGTLLLAVLFMAGCDKDDKGSVNFDRKAMLENYANTVIIPTYENLKLGTDSLKTAVDEFNSNVNANTLNELQRVFLNTYRTWQTAEVFEVGPAKDVLLRGSFNTFPTDTDLISDNVRSGSYNLEAAQNFKAKGFPALDYLLFGLAATDGEILTLYQSDFHTAKRHQYLDDLTEELQTKTNSVLNTWKTGYVETWKNADGTDIGSSTADLVNEFSFTWELTKNPRIGIPLGKKTLNVPLPEKTEAFYSGISVELAVLNLQSLRKVFTAEPVNGGTQGTNLKTYLDELGTEHNGQPLSDAILAQFDVAITKTQLIPNPLSDAVVNNETVVNEAYIEIQKAVVLIKTDMPSAMGVLITYQDSDGD